MAPTTTSPAKLQTSHGTSNQKANVPPAIATSMMITATQAAGELPSPGSVSSATAAPSDRVDASLAGQAGPSRCNTGRDGSALRRILALAQRVPLLDGILGLGVGNGQARSAVL